MSFSHKEYSLRTANKIGGRFLIQCLKLERLLLRNLHILEAVVTYWQKVILHIHGSALHLEDTHSSHREEVQSKDASSQKGLVIYLRENVSFLALIHRFIHLPISFK